MTQPLILIVDDNAVNVDILETRLRAHGYRTAAATDGAQALVAAKELRPDLILLDVMMPVIDGLEVCRRLKADASRPFTPIILVTAKNSTRDIVAGLDAGADDYLSKPVDQAALVARVKSMLRIKAMHDTIEAQQGQLAAQADELREWNRTLEERIGQQLEEIERVGRLKAYFSPQIAELVVSPGSDNLLQSHRREITVVSCDLGGFAALGEQAEPEEMMEVLRQFHSTMGGVIARFGGTLEHFAREGLVVFFNDPVPCPEPTAQAMRMTLAMRREVVALAAGWKARGHDLAFRAGVALGYATLGKLGFEGRFHYGAIGSVMATAACLLDEAEPWQILLTQRVAAASDHVAPAERVGTVQCKGSLKPIALYEVRDLAPIDRSELKPRSLAAGRNARVAAASAADAAVADDHRSPSAENTASLDEEPTPPSRREWLGKLFEATLERPERERKAFIQQACLEDEELRHELELLVDSHQKAGDDFLAVPALGALFEGDLDERIPAGSRLGPYQIDGFIGAGAMGEVYRGHDTALGRAVAIKILPAALARDADRVRRLAAEARAVGSLNHPNILAIYSLGTIGAESPALAGHHGSPYIVSELLEGESLRDRLRASPLSGRKSMEWAVQIARGLSAAHAKGIVHRDLKPENLFVTQAGSIKILDFGLAKVQGAAGSAPAAGTAPGMILGTPGYMAPEQLKGQPADHLADIFSFGAILYEMLTGRRVFPHESVADALRAVLDSEPVRLIDEGALLTPPRLRIIRRCLEVNPVDRFQSASDLAFALESV